MKKLPPILKKVLPIVIATILPSFILNLGAFGDSLQSQAGLYPTLNLAYVNRWWLVPVLILLANVLPTYEVLKSEGKVKANVTKKLLNTLLTDVFNDQRETIRITIFRDAGWFRIFWIWVKEVFRHPVKWLKSGNKHRFPSPLNKYIIATERAGSENPKPQTYFRFVKKTKNECEGIASFVKQIGKEKTIKDMPDINNLDLENFDNLTEKEQNDVKRYLKETFLQDIESLKRLHIKARHFFAQNLKDEMLESKAVLVIDSITEECPFDEETLNKVSSYIKIFSTTF